MDLLAVICLVLLTVSLAHSETQLEEPEVQSGQGFSYYLMSHLFKLEGAVEEIKTTQLKRMEEDIEELKSNTDDSNELQEVKELRQENKAMKAEIEELSQEIKTIKSLNLETELSKLQESKLVLTEGISYLQDSISDIKEIDSALQESNSELQEKSSALQESNSELQESNSELRGSISALQKSNSALQESNSKLQERSTALQNSNTELRKAVSVLQSSKKNGVTYVRWGRTVCPTGSETVYKGYAGGSHYKQSGGGGNWLCLTDQPKWDYYEDGSGSGAYVYGGEYEFGNFHSDGGSSYFGNNMYQKDAPCVVCRPPRPSVVMIPGRNTCYTGWMLEYSGYLVAGYYGHSSKSEFICLDRRPEALAGSIANHNGMLMYLAEGICGSLKCPPYVGGRELTCVVCSK